MKNNPLTKFKRTSVKQMINEHVDVIADIIGCQGAASRGKFTTEVSKRFCLEFWYQLALWTSALIEKPLATQPFKNFPTFYGIKRFTSALHRSVY
jgi:hypothetical protein